MRFMKHRNNLRRYGFAAAILGVATVGVTAPSVAADVKPVTIRFTSDLTGPPHPAAIAKEFFKETIEKRIPGSKVRTYFAGALYNIPEAVEAMTEGNLEMAWGQFGKSAQIDPFMNVVVGPMMMSTPGAMNQLDNFETVKMLKARMAKVHDVKIFATAHLSMYMGAGAGFRLLTLNDFKGKKNSFHGPC